MEEKDRGRYVPWMIFLFFVFLTIVLGGFVMLSIDRHPGMTTENAYEKGLAYNDVIAKDRAQQDLGWNGKILKVRDKVVVEMRDGSGEALSAAKAHVWFYRPSDQNLDKRFLMEEKSAGVYETDVGGFQKGLWDVRIRVSKGGKSIQLSERIVF